MDIILKQQEKKGRDTQIPPATTATAQMTSHPGGLGSKKIIELVTAEWSVGEGWCEGMGIITLCGGTCYHSYNRMDSVPGDMKTESKRQVEKIEVSFEDKIFNGRKFKLKFFPWIRTGELKKLLVKEKFNDKHTHLNEQDLRLFCKNMELAEEKKNFFEYYKIEPGATVIIMANANSHNEQNGVINPYQIFEKTPQEITNLLLNVQSGLNAGKSPKLAAEGTSGTYFLENNQKKVVAVYKPFDQQPYTPNNPRGFAGELGGEGIRKGILSGECATRQVAAYLLDSEKHFHEVPPTAYVEFYHPCFSYREVCNNPIVSHPECDLKRLRTKHGSLQEFVEYMDIVGNLGARQFDVNQVHKIAILDLRILNCDRNEANILVVKKLVTNSKGGTSKLTSLIPIDHGLSFPDNFEIYDHQIVWMGYKQSEMPMSKHSLDFIESIDPLRDCTTLREKLGFREICLRNFRVAQIFLKRLARAGFTLHQIGKFVYREDDDDWSGSEQQQKKEKKPVLSQLQRLVKEAQVIYFTVRDNGIKSTVQFQIGLIRLRKEQQQKQEKEVTSQEQNLQLGSLLKKMSKARETSIEKKQQNSPPKSRHKVRNISLPNLKKKPSNIRDKRMRLKKRKNANERKGESKEKNENWGEVFFHYFEEILQRFVKRKLEMKKSKPLPKPARSRLFSENIEL